MSREPAITCGGSSPLTRGKLTSGEAAKLVGGLIPAHAGKTMPGGERVELGTGSSPLTRGKRVDPVGARDLRGLIPAHAGKTTRPYPRGGSRWAHPRSRGENIDGAPGIHSGMGSSPLTRGKRFPPGDRVHADGLIPAHAGKTRARSSPRRSIRAHPRSRGENAAMAAAVGIGGGSSPLTRGKQPSRMSL